MERDELFKLHLAWIGLIQREGKYLTDWEVQFVLNCKRQLLRGQPLSDKQVTILEKIYADKTP